jgi:hypothetical protein
MKKNVWPSPMSAVRETLEGPGRVIDTKETLRMVRGSMKNLRKGKAGSAVDFTKYRKHLEDMEE